jgi:hypothetical protein
MKKWISLLLLLATPSFGALQAVIYSDLAGNLVNNRAWILNYPQYGLSWDTSSHWLNSLDCTGSTGATSGIASCDWLEVSGPSTLGFSSVHGTTTTVTNVSSGTYIIQVTVHDGASNTSVSTQTIGAVACDSNGVLTPTDPNFTAFFGPTICLGRNPYGWEDERHMAAMIIRNGVYNSTQTVYSTYTIASPDFIQNQAGTINYTFNGTGNSIGVSGTTLTTGISASSMTIIVASTATSVMDLSNFPTRIVISTATYNGPYEEVRICSNTGLTLNVCYDGRGISGTVAGQPTLLGAQGWPSGAVVGQLQFKGSGTNFLTYLSTAGAAYPAGPVKYVVGTATMTAGSATMTGVGTSWLSNVAQGDAVGIAGTHSSTPFVFVAYVSSVVSNTSMTLSRIYPSDADTATGLSYAIIPSFERFFVYRWPRPSPFSGTGQVATVLTGCEDNTHCFSVASIGGRDIPTVDGSSFTSQNYAFSDYGLFFNFVNSSSLGGANFYGENLAWLSMYERSGLSLAKTMATEMTVNWLAHPTWAGGISPGGAPLFYGGPFIGVEAYAAMFGTPAVSELRPWEYTGQNLVNSQGCNDDDSRDTGYSATMGFLGAIYDPDTSSNTGPGGLPWQTYFRNGVGPGAGTTYARDVACKRTNGGVDTNSWSNSFTWNTTIPVTMSNGYSTGTASGFQSSYCTGLDSGTVSVINSSDAITASGGSSFGATAGAIVINGAYFQIVRTDSTHARLSVLWPGSTGTFGYMTTAPVINSDAQPPMGAYGQSFTDSSLKQNYMCMYISPTSFQLDRPFTGTSGANYLRFANLSGYGQQPFMLGIKATGMKYASVLDSALGESYATLTEGASQWIHDYGMNTENTTLNYGRGFSFCESGGSIIGATQVTDWKTPSCSVQNFPPLIAEQEQLIQEAFSGLSYWYQNNATPTNKAFVDAAYAAIYSYSGWNGAGVINNPNSVANQGGLNLTNVQLAAGKYPGQIFGMGFASSWPAIEATTPFQSTGIGTFGGNARFGGNATFQ